MRKLFWVFLGLSVFLTVLSLGSLAQESNQTNVSADNQTEFIEVPNVSVAVQQDIEFLFGKSTYLPGEIIDGKINLKLSNAVDVTKILTFKFNGTEYKKNITSLLGAMNISYTLSEPVIEAVNPSSAENVPIEAGEPRMIALKLPSSVEKVDSINMGLVGSISNVLMNPYIDVGNDNVIDWYYLGSFVNWKSSYISSPDLKETGARDTIIDNNITYYCELVDVPRTRDLRVHARYRKVNDGGNITAAVLSPVAGNPTDISGYGSLCDLPEQASLQYGSCDIHLDYAAEGKMNVCVFSKSMVPNKDLYRLSIDDLQPTSVSAFTCLPNQDWGTCSPYESGDFFIKVQVADYTDNLNADIVFSEWNTYPNSFAKAIEHYVGTEEQEGVCKEKVCTVPIVVYGDGSGLLTFNNLDLRYKSQGSSTVESTFYAILQATRQVVAIGGNDLKSGPMTLEVPISVFGEFKTPAPSYIFAEHKLTARFNQQVADAFIRVYRDNIPQSATARLVDDTSKVITTALSNKDSAKMLTLMQMDSKLNEAKAKLDQYAQSLASGETDALRQEVDAYLSGLPRRIFLKSNIGDKFVAEPADLKDISSAMDPDELYAFQFKTRVLAMVKTYEIEYISGEKTTVMMVTKSLAVSEPMKKITVYEVIPKSIAESVDSIKFEKVPKVVNPDPVVSWYFADFKDTEITYAVLTESQVDIFDFKTIIALAEEEAEVEKPTSECGNAVCENDETAESCPEDCRTTDWTMVVIGAVAALIALLYLVAFLNVSNFRKAALGGMPFKSRSHLDSLESYISSSKSKGVADSKVFVALKQSKWTDAQVKFAYNAVNVDRQLDEQLKKVPQKQKSSGPMKQYLLAGLSRGWDYRLIEGYLMKSGWQKGEISSAFLQARIGMPLRLAFSKLGLKIK